MSYPVRAKKLFLATISFLVHFAHGGLVTVGAGAIVLAVALFAGIVPRDRVEVAAAQPLVAAADAQQDVAVPEAKPSLRPPMQAVVDYLSRRYRVASAAVEPLVHAAQLAGSRLGLDPLLIVAVVAVESRFNPIAESPMGARGLMQVIPRFHKDKLEGDESVLLDPVQNIHVGARVLQESIRRAGSLEAGLQQYAGAPGDEFGQYAAKVIAEKQRIEQAHRKATARRVISENEA